MDSLTQIVLGAACGEVALGKKIGNKAQLFGAIGGTIPDLDVIIGALFYQNEIDSMAFHRGFMHSLVFAVFATVIFGFFSISVITAKDMFRWNEAGWILTKQSIKKYNFNTFNVMAGHTWNWEKYRHLSKLRKKNGFINII